MNKESQAIARDVDTFAFSVLKHSEFMFENPIEANLHYDKFIWALKRLAKCGDCGLSALAELLDDERAVVRVTAACYLIHCSTEKSIKVLTEAAKEDRGIAMLAIITLERWKRGIYFDPLTGKETDFQ